MSEEALLRPVEDNRLCWPAVAHGLWNVCSGRERRPWEWQPLLRQGKLTVAHTSETPGSSQNQNPPFLPLITYTQSLPWGLSWGQGVCCVKAGKSEVWLAGRNSDRRGC